MSCFTSSFSQSAAIYLNRTLQLNATCNASIGAKTDVRALHCITGNTWHKQQKSVSDIQIWNNRTANSVLSFVRESLYCHYEALGYFILQTLFFDNNCHPHAWHFLIQIFLIFFFLTYPIKWQLRTSVTFMGTIFSYLGKYSDFVLTLKLRTSIPLADLNQVIFTLPREQLWGARKQERKKRPFFPMFGISTD